MVANHNKRKNSGTVLWCYYELQPSILLAIVLRIIINRLVCFIIFRFFFMYFCFIHQVSVLVLHKSFAAKLYMLRLNSTQN